MCKTYTCDTCDYTLTENEFDAGKGRIMFSEGEGIEDGQFRCGVCDIRASHDGYEDLRRCATCDEELDEEYWKAFAFEKCAIEPNPVYCCSECETEECDQCGNPDVAWCMSNGCDKGQRRIETYSNPI